MRAVDDELWSRRKRRRREEEEKEEKGGQRDIGKRREE